VALEKRFLREGLPALTRGFDAPKRSLPGIASTVGRGTRDVWKNRREVRANVVRGAPVVLVLLVALFVTSEVWRFFGPIGGGRLPAVVILFVILGIAVLVSALAAELSGVYRTATRLNERDLKGAANHIPEARPLIETVPLPSTRRVPKFRLRLWQQLNIGLVLAAPLFVIAALVGVSTFLIFLVVGVVGIDETLTSEWISPRGGRPLKPNVWLTIPVRGQEFILSAELLRVSAFLASVAALAFTNTAVRDSELRKKLIARKCKRLKNLVAAWVFYRAVPEREGS
jgi:hypothetical protein